MSAQKMDSGVGGDVTLFHTSQLDKLINVIDIVDFPAGASVERELLLATLEAAPEVRGQIVDLVGIFDGRVLNVGRDKVTVSLDGHPTKLDDFEDLLRPYGIVMIKRTGRVALPKLDRSPPAALRSVDAS